MGIDNLNIFCICYQIETKTINSISTDKGSKVNYMEINSYNFIKYLNSEANFLEYNKNSLYILREEVVIF